MTTKPNIALVVLDTLRKDFFDEYFGYLPGTSYENAWSTTHYSSAAHGSLVTGRFGSEIGVHGKSPQFDCPDPMIAELLSEKGYNTRGYSANTYASKYFNFDRGFDEFYNETRVVGGEEAEFNWPRFIKEHKNEGPRRYLELLTAITESDAAILPVLKQGAKIKLKDLGLIEYDSTYEDGKKSLDFVESATFQSSGEFLFMNLMDVHGPYIAPQEYQTVDPIHPDSLRTMLADEPDFSPEHVKTAYEDCVRYLSEIYRDLHGLLVEDFNYVITLSDHGEAFGEYGVWGHSGLGPEVTNIPLSICGPSDNNHIEPTDQPVNLHDIFQTICDLGDVDTPDRTRGDSLTNASEFQNRYKLLETHGLSTEKKRGLVESGYDPDELDLFENQLHGIASKDGYAFETFQGTTEYIGEQIPDAKERMDTLVNDLDRRTDVDNEAVPDHVHERLEELGYT